MDRPRSPWTPSYSVTTQGPGLSEQEIVQLPEDKQGESTSKPEDSDNLQVEAGEVQSLPTIQTDDNIHDLPERPKSPYPPSYSVTQMGPPSPKSPAASDSATLEPETEVGVETMESSLPLNAENLDLLPNDTVQTSDQSKGIGSASHVPEASSSPQSSLGALTPFDSRSEVSEASHEPIAATTPRSEPDTLSTAESESETPLVMSTVLVANEDNVFPESASVERTPLVSTARVADIDEHTTGPITPAVDAPTSDKAAKHAFDRPESIDLGLTTVVDEDQINKEEHLSIVDTRGEEPVNAALDIQIEPTESTAEDDVVQTIDNGKQAIKDTQPIAVTTTFSKDSAYTQATDDTFTSDLTEDTNITTPDIETLVMPKLDTDFATEEAGSTDVFDEATIKQVSSGPASAVESVRSTPNRQSTGNIAAVGIGHDLTKTFPPAFPTSAGASSEQLP